MIDNISYTPTDWINNTTPLNQANMNNIEHGISQVTTAVNNKLPYPDIDKASLIRAVLIGNWGNDGGNSSTNRPLSIEYREFMKGAEDAKRSPNSLIQRTENANVMIPSSFPPADAGGGVDSSGNVIANMAVPKFYVDNKISSITTNAVSWHTTKPTDTSKVLASKVQGAITLTIDSNSYTCYVTLITWSYATKNSLSEGQSRYTGWEYGTITVSAYDSTTYTPLSGIGVPVYAIDADEFHINIDKNGTKVPVSVGADDLDKLTMSWLY